MNRNRPLEDDLARDILTEYLGRRADPDTFLTYRHFRVPCYEPVASDNGWEIEYRGYDARGGVTFCVVAEPDSECLYISVAECSDKDLFNKNLGRMVSFGRFQRTGDFLQTSWNRDITIAENLELLWDRFGLRHDFQELELSVKNRFIED